MKIVIDNDCGLCNKLWSIVNPVLWAQKHQKKIFICSYDKNYKYFPSLSKNKYIIDPFIQLHPSIGYRLSHHLRLKLIYLSERNKKLRKLLWRGWDSIHTKVESSDMPMVREIFRPSDSIINKLEEVFNEKRKKYDKIIGVHIRRGDYKDFFDGKYYYSFNDYLVIMLKLQSRFKSNVCFFISSNEEIPEEVFQEVPYFNFDKDIMLDLYGLSYCDYIIGPPSTFSMWAAFYSGIPLAVIDKKNRPEYRFHTITSCLTFEIIEKCNEIPLIDNYGDTGIII